MSRIQLWWDEAEASSTWSLNLMMYESGMFSASIELRTGADLSWMVPTPKVLALAAATSERVRAYLMMTNPRVRSDRGDEVLGWSTGDRKEQESSVRSTTL